METRAWTPTENEQGASDCRGSVIGVLGVRRLYTYLTFMSDVGLTSVSDICIRIRYLSLISVYASGILYICFDVRVCV